MVWETAGEISEAGEKKIFNKVSVSAIKNF